MAIPSHHWILLYSLTNVDLIIDFVSNLIDIHRSFVRSLSRLCARPGACWFVSTIITIVGPGFEQFTQALAAGYVANVRGGYCVCIVNETAAQGIVARAIEQRCAHIVFDPDPSGTIETEQAIGEIIQSQCVLSDLRIGRKTDARCDRQTMPSPVR